MRIARRAGHIKGVGTVPTIKAVISRTSHDRIITRTGIDQITACAIGNHIVACTSINQIDAIATINGIRTVTGRNGIVGTAARDGVIARAGYQIFKSGNNVRTGFATVGRTIGKIDRNVTLDIGHIKRIGAIATRKGVVTRIANNRIVACTGIYNVVTGTTIEVIIAIAAVDAVIARIGPDRVIARSGINCHIAIGMIFAGQIDNVIAVTCIDDFNINDRRACCPVFMITIKNDGVIAAGANQCIGIRTTIINIVAEAKSLKVGNIAGAINARATNMVGTVTSLTGAVGTKLQNIVTCTTVKGITA